LPSETDLRVVIPTKEGNWSVDGRLWAQVGRDRLVEVTRPFDWVERRTTDRFQRSIPVEVATHRGLRSGWTIDISTGGCRLLLNGTLIAGELIRLRIDGLDHDVDGRVVHQGDDGVGVQFLERLDVDLARLGANPQVPDSPT
jgi:hypothetical protein